MFSTVFHEKYGNYSHVRIIVLHPCHVDHFAAAPADGAKFHLGHEPRPV